MISRLLDHLSEFVAHRKGLLPLCGLLLVAVNLVLQFTAPGAWLATTNLLLHLGVMIAIFGLLLAWAL